MRRGRIGVMAGAVMPDRCRRRPAAIRSIPPEASGGQPDAVALIAAFSDVR